MLVPLLFSVSAQSAIYKCVNESSEVYYNDKPCPIKDKESQIQAVKDPVNPYIAPFYVESGASEIESKETLNKISSQPIDSDDEKISKKEQKQSGGNQVNNISAESSQLNRNVSESESRENQISNSTDESSRDKTVAASGSSLKLKIIHKEPLD